MCRNIQNNDSRRFYSATRSMVLQRSMHFNDFDFLILIKFAAILVNNFLIFLVYKDQLQKEINFINEYKPLSNEFEELMRDSPRVWNYPIDNQLPR